jgi:hypothetical protein
MVGVNNCNRTNIERGMFFSASVLMPKTTMTTPPSGGAYGPLDNSLAAFGMEGWRGDRVGKGF